MSGPALGPIELRIAGRKVRGEVVSVEPFQVRLDTDDEELLAAVAQLAEAQRPRDFARPLRSAAALARREDLVEGGG